MRRRPKYLYDQLSATLIDVLFSFDYEKIQKTGFINEKCAKSSFHNSVYATGLKSYVFATAACSVELTVEEMIKCPYVDRTACSSKFTFAHAGMNSKLECVLNDFITFRWRVSGEKLEQSIAVFDNALMYFYSIAYDVSDTGLETGVKTQMRTFAKMAHAYVDLTECNAMELGFRLTNIATALISPLLDEMGVSPEYDMPLADGGSFKQPRPLEASINALLVGMNPAYFYGIHAAADLAQAQISFMDVVVDNTFGNPCSADGLSNVQCMVRDMAKLAARYRYWLPMIATRSTVLSYRDAIMSSLYALYGFDSVSDITQVGTDTLAAIGEGIVLLAKLFQELVYLVSEPFFEAIEAAIEVIRHVLSHRYGRSSKR